MGNRKKLSLRQTPSNTDMRVQFLKEGLQRRVY